MMPHPYGCPCLSCRARRAQRRSKHSRLDRQAAQMRAFYLTHGTGCKTRARVISSRVGAAGEGECRHG
jgi:hypothetical protein